MTADYTVKNDNSVKDFSHYILLQLKSLQISE